MLAFVENVDPPSLLHAKVYGPGGVPDGLGFAVNV
jgi:hypothetical protein